jgi:branched-chain amino acid transport system ATP-binding protein
VTAVLDVRNVHVWIGGSHILQGVTFSVPQGAVTALLGRNGVGKTTTLRAVLGLLPRTGEVRLGEERIDGRPTFAVVRCGVGYVPEDRDVFAGLTVAENLKLAERTGQTPRYELVYDLFPELAHRARQAAGTLSGGQQQMLSLGRALLNDNQLLLVDEPTKGLAPKVVGEVAAALERACRVSTLLLVEQDLGVVRRIADTVAVLEQGAVVHTGDAAALLADAQLTRQLLGVSTARGSA